MYFRAGQQALQGAGQGGVLEGATCGLRGQWTELGCVLSPGREFIVRHAAVARRVGYTPPKRASNELPTMVVPVTQGLVTAVLSMPEVKESTAVPLQLHMSERFRIDIDGDFAPSVLAKLLRTLEEFA